jgi:hypothetical protein
MKTLKWISNAILLCFFGSITWVSASYIIPNSAVTTAKIASHAVTQPLLAPRAVASPVPIGGIGISSSSSNVSTSSTSPTAVPNLSVTITTSGRPVLIFLQPDSSGNPSSVGVISNGQSSTTDQNAYIYFYRGASQLAYWSVYNQVGTTTANSNALYGNDGFLFLDTPTAGTYTYSVKYAVQNSSYSAIVDFVTLVAYEI